MDRIVSFMNDVKFDNALESLDVAIEAMSVSGANVIVPTNEYDRLRNAGILSKVDEIKAEVKSLKNAQKKNPSEVKKRAGELIQSLNELKADVNKIQSDPVGEKKAAKIILVLTMLFMVIMSVLGTFSTVKGNVEFMTFGTELASFGESLGRATGIRAATKVGAVGAVAGGVTSHQIFKWVEMKKTVLKSIDKLIDALRLIQNNPE